MKLEKKTKTHKILKRNDGRYAVKTLKGQSVNGDDKIAILLAEGLITAPEPKAAEPEVAEAAAEETPEAPAEEATETPAEEAPAAEPEAAEEPAAEAEEAPAEVPAEDKAEK